MQGIILYDKGKIGSLNQCRGLANALKDHINISWQEVPVEFSKIVRWFPPQMGLMLSKPYVLGCLNIDAPKILLASGRQAVLAALSLRQGCYTIVLQDPKINPTYFDLVVAPQHDNLQGKNVLSTVGSFHNITTEELAPVYAPLCASTDIKYITVLLGGDSRHHTYTHGDFLTLSEQLRHMLSLQAYRNGRLLITPSRRTRPELVEYLKETLSGLSYELWNGSDPNPYKKYLAAAHAFVVTSDSVNMITEACLFGKPTYIFQVPMKSKRLQQFLTTVFDNKNAVPFTQQALESPTDFRPLNEIQRLIPEILVRIKDKK